MENICVLCKNQLNDGQPTVTLREKGSNGINRASSDRRDNITVCPGQVVHIDCRKDYCNQNLIQKHNRVEAIEDTANVTTALRSKSEQFSFKEMCLFCGKTAKLTKCKRGIDVYAVRTLQFQDAIHQICKERADDWSMEVCQRLNLVTDLPAADAIYHQSCNVNFRTLKRVPTPHASSSNKRFKGRPADEELENSFKLVVKFLEENDDEQITMIDLVNKMREFCGDAAYSVTYLKKKLKEHFGEGILITEINGKANVVTLRRTATSILHDFYRQQENRNSDFQKDDIIKTAAKLILSDIKSINTNKSEYPSPSHISSVTENLDYIPDSLRIFLQTVFTKKNADVKVAAIGQAIVQNARPRVILSPLQLALGVQLHHQFASKFLIETLNSLGFCASYTEIQKFELSAAVSTGTEIPQFTNDKVVQYVADNVDHNIRTLDGHGTFHGMGIIACVTPGTKNNLSVTRKSVTKEDILAAGDMSITYYTQGDSFKIPIRYEELTEMRMTDLTWKLDLLIRLTWSIRPQRPGWSGLMQTIQHGNFPGKSSVSFMPMIDMAPSDLSCIYTTLKFVCDHAAKHDVHPILTFDQPLYWKALTIILNEPENSPLHNIVLRLGGFHTLMSFIGSIGQLMQGSGLNEVLETVYAPNAVVHMATGKAFARAIRGHLLVDRALSCLLLNEIFDIPLPENELEADPDTSNDMASENIGGSKPENETLDETREIQNLGVIFDDLLSEKVDINYICNLHILDELKEKLSCGKQKLQDYRTAKLWLQYMHMIELMQSFIKAERTGDWILHLQTLKCMLPYFAAAGHNLYLKSAYVYLQIMGKLDETHKDVHESFMKGNHVVRRTNKYWSGLSTDLMIEQVLMRSVKTSGGLTRGKGMNETQRTQWLLSLPICSEINTAVQDFTGTSYQTSNQHKESGKTRQGKDFYDTQQILGFLLDRNPFSKEHTLRNIETGVAADASVNVDSAYHVGQQIVQSMTGKDVIGYTFKKAKQAVVLTSKTAVKMCDDSVHVDPQLLFQRLTTAVARSEEDDISNLFSYELSSIPSAIFDPNGLPRQAQKATLADAIWSLGNCGITNAEFEGMDIQHVLDGGSLLHRIPWQQGNTYGQICNTYIDYITRKYVDPVVVFDGYRAGPSIKDITHIRRTHGIVGANVHFKDSTPFKGKKETFLTNSENKQHFIDMLGDEIIKRGHRVLHAYDDADVLVAKTAVECAKTRNVMLIGEDTDILVLLCYHVDTEIRHKVFFRSEGRQNTKIWDIQRTKSAIGLSMCVFLPFLHAITGCDTTSRMFGIGKGTALKKLMMEKSLQLNAKVFNNKSTKTEIQSAGENAIVILNGGQEIEGLDLLRFRKFTKRVTSSTSFVQVHTLPPTAAAVKYHNWRVYYQVQQWIGENVEISPLDWGWTMTDGKLVPIKTDLPAAPEKLMKIIKCSCKANSCDTRRCTCRKHGLECTVGCGECRGISCSNTFSLTESDIADNI